MELEVFESLFLSYATGHLSAAEALVVRAATELNAEARKAVARMEALAGRALEDAVPADLCGGCLETVLARIARPDLRAAPEAPCASVIDVLTSCRPPAGHGAVMRRSLRAPGPDVPGQRLLVVSVAPGVRVTLAGARLTLVLEGSCGEGRFRPGDLIAARGAPFALKADAEGALLLVVSGPAPVRRIFARLLGVWSC